MKKRETKTERVGWGILKFPLPEEESGEHEDPANHRDRK